MRLFKRRTYGKRSVDPTRVGFQDIEPHLSRMSKTSHIFGLDMSREPVVVDLSSASPNLLICAGVGAGTSTLARTILTQAMAKGSEAIILDGFGRRGYAWAQRLDRCEYHDSIEAVHDRLVDLHDEFWWRARYPALTDGEIDVYVLVEHTRAMFSVLQQYWATTKDPGATTLSPAVVALRDLLSGDHPTGFHILATGALPPSCDSTGGPGAREQWGVKFLSHYTSRMWQIAAPEVSPVPRRPTVRGRFHIVRDGRAIEIQVAYLTLEEARTLAQRGA